MRAAVVMARGRVLDVGTGAGRHALALQQQGKDVVGLDPSPGAVEVARRCGVAAELGSIAHPPEGIGAFFPHDGRPVFASPSDAGLSRARSLT